MRIKLDFVEQAPKRAVATLQVAYCVLSQLVQNAGNGEGEWRDRCFEICAVVGFHMVATLHRADRRLQYRAARIAKRFARIQMRLFAHDTVARHFLNFAICIGNYPVAAE